MTPIPSPPARTATATPPPRRSATAPTASRSGPPTRPRTPTRPPTARAFTIDSAAPDAPSIEDSDPDSPANENNPELKGTAEAGSTVRIYQSGDCSGPVEAQGSAGAFATPGLTATVDNDSTSTFTATASDAGNTSECSAAFTYTEDSTAPETTIDTGPSGDTNDNTPTFTFSSSEPNSSFQCRFDADPFAACSDGDSHTASPALGDGPHSFEVRATDQAQNTDQTPDTRAFTIDSAAPDAPSIEDSDPDSPANENNPELKGTAEAGSTVRIYQSGDCSGPVEAQGSAGAFATPGLTATVDNDSTSTFTATASDAGNTSECSAAFTYTEDSTAPETTIDTGPSGDTNDNTPTFTFSSSEPNSSFQCRFDADPFAACSDGDSHTASPALGDGPHSFEVRATDQAQNTDQTPDSRAFTIDSAAPDAPSIEDSDPDSPANENNPELKGDRRGGLDGPHLPVRGLLGDGRGPGLRRSVRLARAHRHGR